MPIYDYKCKCGKEFDKLLTIDKGMMKSNASVVRKLIEILVLLL